MTLVEMVVALAIIAVMSGVAGLSVGAFHRAAAPDTEARLLAARINLASDVALIEGRAISLTWDGNGYEFGGDRLGSPAMPATGRHEFPAGLRLVGPSPTGSLAIRESGAGPVSFLVRGRESAWNVAFNGLTAEASLASER